MHDRMALYTMRIIAALSAITIGLLLLLYILTMAMDIDPKLIIDLQKANVGIGALGVLLGLFGPISVMLLWVLMLYHWGTHQFESAHHKKVWLVVLLLGNVLSALVYYFVVFEMGKTLRKKEAH